MIRRSPFLALALASLVASGQAVLATPLNDQAEFSVVHGQNVEALAYPEVVHLSIPQQRSGVISQDCGATIIDDYWLLSAAHCFEGYDHNRQVTVTVRTAYSQAKSGTVYARPLTSDAVFAHPDFATDFAAGGPTRGKYDVALIRLIDPISSTKPIDPVTLIEHERKESGAIALPKVTLADAGTVIPRSGQGIVVGRGASRWVPANTLTGAPAQYDHDTAQLRHAQLPIQADCQSPYHVCAGERVPSEPLGDLPPAQRHDPIAHRKPSSCVGDSGGPLYVSGADGGRTQVGIVSHSRYSQATQTFWEQDLCGRVSTWYTSVSYVKPWIDAVMAANPRHGGQLPSVDLPIPPTGQETTPPKQGGDDKPKPPITPPAPPPQVLPPVNPPSAPISPPQPDPVPSDQPSEGKPDDQREGDPVDGVHRKGDPALLQHLPNPKTPVPPMVTWPVGEMDADEGSTLSVGAARLRRAYSTNVADRELAGRRTALLASEYRMADALASGVLQRNATLFLTDPKSLEPLVEQELRAQGFTDVWILGGEQAVSAKVETDLKQAGFLTRRLAGADRTQTAIEIADNAVAFQANTPTSRYLSRAFGDTGDETRTWADAIALGALSARTSKPVLLAPYDAMTDNVAARLRAGVSVTLVGGPQAIAPEVGVLASELTGLPTFRIAGQNRAGTAGEIANHFAKPTKAIVIDGQSPNAWQLGFSLAGLAADSNAPILLTAGKTIPPETKAAITKLGIREFLCFADKAVCTQLQP